MAVQSKHFHFSRHTGAGNDGAAASTIGATVCNLTPSQTARINQQFDQSLIVWVVGKKIHPRQLAVRLRRNLHLAGDLDVFELGLGFFVLKFSNALDYYEALEERPWSIPHLCIYVFPWIPNFKPSEASIPFVDVWIRLPELSIEYYDKEVLEKIAETIGGRLVKIDPVTETREKCMYARICIRMNLGYPLNLSFQFGKNPQKIVYEGLDLLCIVCGCVDDLKHDCLSNRSSSSGFDPHHHRARPLQATGSSLSSNANPCSSSNLNQNQNPSSSLRSNPNPNLSSSSNSNSNLKMQLIPSKPAPASARGSRFQVLELNLNEEPSLPVSESDKEVKESPSITMKAPLLKQTNLIQSVPLAPCVLEDHQFRTEKTSSPTTLAVQNNEPQPPSLAIKSIAPLQPSSALEAGLKFYSTAIQQSTIQKAINNTPSERISVDSLPTIYTIDPTITSLAIELLELSATTTRSNQNEHAIHIVPTSEAVSMSASCCSKKMLCWNFRATDNAKLMRALKDLIQLHKPSIVLIFGTKIGGTDADHVVRELAFDGSYCRKPDGYRGGAWLLLSQQDVQIEVSSYSPQQVSASVILPF
ncbi:hypothetical protein SDJN02_04821, partial [Cucurbita argyrosperma subsp. argyrosperma]